jgi:beta-xylosidase
VLSKAVEVLAKMNIQKRNIVLKIDIQNGDYTFSFSEATKTWKSLKEKVSSSFLGAS